RKMFEAIVPGRIRLLKIRRLQNQNDAAHAIVDFTMNRDYARLVEDDCARFFLLAKAAQVETLRFRIGKNIVISVVHVGKLDGGTDAYGNKIGREGDILLRHL